MPWRDLWPYVFQLGASLAGVLYGMNKFVFGGMRYGLILQPLAYVLISSLMVKKLNSRAFPIFSGKKKCVHACVLMLSVCTA